VNARGPVYVVKLHCRPGADGVYAVRAALKQFTHFGLRCVSVSPGTEWRADREIVQERRKESVMDMRKFAGKSFIKVDDVRNAPLQVKIAVVKQGQYDKPDLVFETGEIPGLNATNTKILVRAYGPDSDDWVGKEIELYLGEVEYQKDFQPAVLVRPISPSITAAAKSAAAKKLGDEEEAPF
jgi:hypothetical protein